MHRWSWTVLTFAILVSLLMAASTPSYAAPRLVIAQTDSETEGETGQSPEADTKAGEAGSEPAEKEPGPPWTYQMARIGLVLLVFLALSIGMAYYRFVASRQRGAA